MKHFNRYILAAGLAVSMLLLPAAAEQTPEIKEAPVPYAAQSQSIYYTVQPGNYELYCEKINGKITVRRIVGEYYDPIPDLNIPDYIDGCKVTRIYENAFSGRTKTGTRSVHLPKYLENIGNGAFKECTGMVTPVFPEGLETIGNEAFAGCTGMKGKLVLPDSVWSIGRRAFTGVENITSLTLPKQPALSVGDRAFAGCTGIRGTVVLPVAMDWSDECAMFYGCTGIEKAVLAGEDGKNDYQKSIPAGSFEGCTSLREVVFPARIDFIRANAFRNTALSGNLVLPTYLREVGDNAFEGTKITSVTMSGKIDTIGSRAFQNCKNLKTLNLGDTMASLGNEIFEGSGLEKVNFEGTWERWDLLVTGITQGQVLKNAQKQFSCNNFVGSWQKLSNGDTGLIKTNGEAYRNQWVCRGRKEYFLDANGSLKRNSWIVRNYYISEGVHPNSFYLGAEGVPLKGWQTIGLDKYYFSTTISQFFLSEVGSAYTGYREIEGEYYVFDQFFRQVTGFVELDREWCRFGDDKLHYFDPQTGRQLVGWQSVDGETYYFIKDPAQRNYGAAVVGRQNIDGVEFYFFENAAVLTGWGRITVDGTEKFLHGDVNTNALAVNATVDGGNFNAQGYLRSLNGPKWIEVNNGKGWMYLYSDLSYPQKSWDIIEGEKYYFNRDGFLATNCFTYETAPDGTQLLHYAGEDGKMLRDTWITVGVEDFYFDADGNWVENPFVQTGWVFEEGGWRYYYPEGKMASNAWIQDGSGNWCYVGSDGFMAVNCWAEDSAGWCYVGSDGYLVTNAWMKDSYDWCYLDESGHMATNRWVEDNSGWCYVGGNGYLVTNAWMADSLGWCYLDESGHMAKNRWVEDNSGWCYVGSDGYLVTNAWVKDNYDWCYLDESGHTAKNRWIEDGSGWCYLDGNGYILRDGYAWDSTGEHYLDASGHMAW